MDPRLALRFSGRLHTLLATLLVGCAEVEGADEARRLFVVEGFDQPESVQYDADQDVYFVSSMAGVGSAKDGIGYISTFSAVRPQPPAVFVQGGEGGVVLDAPKGMAIQGDTLWVADIDVIRGFHRRTGDPVGEVDLRPYGAVLLNSLAAAPDGTLYASDSAIIMAPAGVLYSTGQKIFAIRGGVIRVIAEGDDLGFPNGLDWDVGGDRLVVASFHPFASEVYALDPESGQRVTLASGIGRFDGVTSLGDGRLLFTSWRDSTLQIVEGDQRRRVVGNLWQPADFGIDTRRNRVAIPLVLPSQVVIWELPR